MNTLVLVALLTGLATLVTFVWLLARAFSKHTAWGMAVLLFSPVSAVAFGIKYWRQNKAPFLAYLTTWISAATLSLYLFTSWGGWDLLRISQHVQSGIASHSLTEDDIQALISVSQAFDEQSGLEMQSSSLLEQAKKELGRQARQLAAEETAKKTASHKQHYGIDSIDKKAKSAQKRYRLAYLTIKVSDAPNYVGSTVKVTRKNVVEKEYRLIGASSNRLEFIQRAGSGSFTFEYKNSDIEKIRVLTKQPY